METVGVETTFSLLNVSTAAIWSDSCEPEVDASPARDDLQSHLIDKSPISLLQELCMKRGLKPAYELTDSEGPVHERVFTFEVSAGPYTATGKGSSKKRARHAGATIVITEMLKHSETSSNLQQPASDQSTDETCGFTLSPACPPSPGGNPVGTLQEVTQKKCVAPPVYEFEDNGRPPHELEYTCTARLRQLTETACARTKKQAKRLAASQLLEQLSHATDPLDGCDENHASAPPDTDDYSPLEAALPGEVVSQSAYAMLRDGQTEQSVATCLKAKQLTAAQCCTIACMQVLQEIADTHQFSVTYVDVMEPTGAGHQQCFVQLSTMPVILCRGVGRTKAEARTAAAADALRCVNHVLAS